MPTSLSPLPILPPPDAILPEVLRDYPLCLALRLFTNDPGPPEARTLASYAEPTFPGYEPFNSPSWKVVTNDVEAGLVVVSVQAKWRLTATVEPVTIMGWWLTALYADDYLQLVGDYTSPTPLIIGQRGETVLALVTLSTLLQVFS